MIKNFYSYYCYNVNNNSYIYNFIYIYKCIMIENNYNRSAVIIITNIIIIKIELLNNYG